MASRYVFTTSIDPNKYDWTHAASGGTITGASGAIELVYDDTAFTTAEGKERLILAVESLLLNLKDGNTTYPTA